MSKKVLLDPSTGLEDRNARPEVVAAKLHEMAEHCGGERPRHRANRAWSALEPPRPCADTRR